jgi:ribosome-binding factor A
MKHHRVARVAAIIREVASETILFKISDPRVHLVTVTRVEVAADLQHAKVYVSIMGTPAQQRKAMVGLQHAAGFIQSQLGDRMRTRYTPVLRFVFDDGIKQSIEISRLISEALGRNAKDQPPDDSAMAEEIDADDIEGDEEDDTEEESNDDQPEKDGIEEEDSESKR